MRTRIWIFNLLLVASAIALGWQVRKDWHAFAAQNRPQSLVLRPFPGVSAPGTALPAEYLVIASQNPFQPDRNDVIQQPQVQAQVPTAPPPVVYGSVILGETRYALMAPDEAGAPQKVQEGQSMNGYRLARVQPQSVILETSSGQTEIMLYNAMAKLRRDHSRTVASASAPAAQAPVRSTSIDTQPSVAPTAAPAPSSIASAPSTPTPPVPAGKKVVQTPFGPMVVDDAH
jgi:hypothetical protein